MSPTNMHFHDNCSYSYCPITVSNPGIPPPGHVFYTVPQQLPYWYIPQRTFAHHCAPPQNMECQNPAIPRRLSKECGASSKKLKFSIDSILGLNDEEDITSSTSPMYESCQDENRDPDRLHYLAATSTQGPLSQYSDSTSPKPSCTSESSCGSPERHGKQKRMRTIFTPEQLQRLEEEFARQQYMVGEERLYLAHSLGLSEAQVKVWFQNRRIKYRRQTTEMQQSKLLHLQSSESKSDEDDFCQQMSPSSSEEAENRDCSEESSNSD